MFQQSDDFNIDEEFLNDAFDSVENIIKKSLDTNENQPIKKCCREINKIVEIHSGNDFTSQSNENVINLFTDKQTYKDETVNNNNLDGMVFDKNNKEINKDQSTSKANVLDLFTSQQKNDDHERLILNSNSRVEFENKNQRSVLNFFTNVKENDNEDRPEEIGNNSKNNENKIQVLSLFTNQPTEGNNNKNLECTTVKRRIESNREKTVDSTINFNRTKNKIQPSPNIQAKKFNYKNHSINVLNTDQTRNQDGNKEKFDRSDQSDLLNLFAEEFDENKSISNNTKTITFKSPAVNRKVVKRKFPGPAGILPDQPVNINIKVLENCDISINNKTNISDDMLCSQSYVSCFKEGLWLVMLKDYYSREQKFALPEKYSISWLKTKANARVLLGQKTPFLAAIIQSIEFNGNFPIAILKDPTGEIPATICNEVWNEYSEKLHVGSVIALRQVGVLTTHKKHYLNITLNNIITIYSHRNHVDEISPTQNTQKNYESEIIQIENVTCSDILRNIEETKTRYKNIQNVTVPTENDNPFFKNRSVNNEFRKPLGVSNINRISNIMDKSCDFGSQDIISSSVDEGRIQADNLRNKSNITKLHGNATKTETFVLNNKFNFQKLNAPVNIRNQINISNSTSTNRVEIILDTSSSKCSSSRNEEMINRLFDKNGGLNNEFITSTQSDTVTNSDNKNIFEELDGLEESFFEDF